MELFLSGVQDLAVETESAGRTTSRTRDPDQALMDRWVPILLERIEKKSRSFAT